jgi:hypothetical protein
VSAALPTRPPGGAAREKKAAEKVGVAASKRGVSPRAMAASTAPTPIEAHDEQNNKLGRQI